MPSRRACLAALAALAGCSGTRPSTTATHSSTTTRPSTTPGTATSTATTTDTTATETPATEPAVSVAGVSVQESFFYLASPDSLGVAAPDGRQFAFASVAGSDHAPPPDGFALVAGGDRHAGWTEYDRWRGPEILPEGVVGHRAYEPGSGGWVGFDLPDPLDADGARLVVGDYVAWQVEQETLAVLNAPPARYSLVEVTAPDRVAADESAPVSVTVENVGDGDGTFRGVVNEAGPTYTPHRFRLSIPAGERRSETVDLSSHVGSDADAVGYRLRSAAGDAEGTVRLGTDE